MGNIKSEEGLKTDSLPVDKVVSEKEICLAIKALLLQKFLNANTKEWGKIAIKFTLTLKTDLQTVMHVIKDVMNDQNGKAQEWRKELETYW